MKRRGNSRIAAGVLAILASLAGPAPAKEHCDPLLAPAPGTPFAYEDRGDRCEGLFVREVSGSAGLLVVSLTESFEEFDPQRDSEVVVGWSPPARGATRLRAFGLKRRQYYRMDAVRPEGVSSYRWPTNVMASLKIPSKEIGLVAWTTHTFGKEPLEAYLPLRIGKPAPESGATRPTLTLLPGAELAEVYVSVWPLLPDGRPGPPLRREQALGHGYYPAERPLMLPLPELKTAGFYQLEIGVLLRAGGSVVRKLVIYHAGR